MPSHRTFTGTEVLSDELGSSSSLKTAPSTALECVKKKHVLSSGANHLDSGSRQRSWDAAQLTNGTKAENGTGTSRTSAGVIVPARYIPVDLDYQSTTPEGCMRADQRLSVGPSCSFSRESNTATAYREERSVWADAAASVDGSDVILSPVAGGSCDDEHSTVSVGQRKLAVQMTEHEGGMGEVVQMPQQHLQLISPLPPPGRQTAVLSNLSENVASNVAASAVKAENSVVSAPPPPPPPPRYVCHICDRKFERQPSLARHLVLHRGVKQFSCEDCGQKFSHTFNLERHRKRVHQQQQQQQGGEEQQQQQHVRCTSCGTWFPSPMVLKVGSRP
jgi:DNA-directed RNA polymerase subunit RPC12/RpoP